MSLIVSFMTFSQELEFISIWSPEAEAGWSILCTRVSEVWCTWIIWNTCRMFSVTGGWFSRLLVAVSRSLLKTFKVMFYIECSINGWQWVKAKRMFLSSLFLTRTQILWLWNDTYLWTEYEAWEDYDSLAGGYRHVWHLVATRRCSKATSLKAASLKKAEQPWRLSRCSLTLKVCLRLPLISSRWEVCTSYSCWGKAVQQQWGIEVLFSM